MNDAPDVIVGLPSTTPLSPKSTATVSLVGRQSGGTPAGRTNPGAITASLKHSKYLAPILTSHTLGSSLLVGRGGGAGTAYAEGPSWSVPAYGMFNQSDVQRISHPASCLAASVDLSTVEVKGCVGIEIGLERLWHTGRHRTIGSGRS